MPLPVVAIVGRPNVGKSTLFNRLVGFKKSVVHDRPGVTRDRLYQEAELLGREVILVDTGGLEPDPETTLLMSMRTAAMVAVEEADVIVFMVDGRAGLTPADGEVADILRRSGRPLVLAVNKVDGHDLDALSSEFWTLGVESLNTISAEHGRGVYELLEAIEAALPEPVDDWDESEEGEDVPATIRIAVIGRPNIGKSTLINRLLGEEKHLVHDSPGTTTDPVDSKLHTEERDYVLVDTAGVRKRRKIDDVLEKFISLRAIRSIERCHISLLVIDATVGVTEQDARLAHLVESRGRGLIVLVNKWDLTPDLEDVNARAIEDQLDVRFPHAWWAPHLYISALTGKGCGRILSLVEQVYVGFNRRVGTPELNRWLKGALDAHTPPQRYHRPVRIYYMTQNRVRPPTFTFFSNTPEGIKTSYRRYLSNSLRADYDFEGSPLRLHFRRRRKLNDQES
jgi:GTP-binding protein